MSILPAPSVVSLLAKSAEDLPTPHPGDLKDHRGSLPVQLPDHDKPLAPNLPVLLPDAAASSRPGIPAAVLEPPTPLPASTILPGLPASATTDLPAAVPIDIGGGVPPIGGPGLGGPGIASVTAARGRKRQKIKSKLEAGLGKFTGRMPAIGAPIVIFWALGVLLLLLPPLAVLLFVGRPRKQVLICFLLWLMGYFPGLVYAVAIIIRRSLKAGTLVKGIPGATQATDTISHIAPVPIP